MAPYLLALPVVRTLEQCGSFEDTVLPYIKELKDFPQRLLESASSLESLKEFYLKTNPLVTAFAACLILSVFFFVVAEFNRNYSQVDRAWSLLPTLYIAHYVAWAHLNQLPSNRLDHLISFGVIWSVSMPAVVWLC